MQVEKNEKEPEVDFTQLGPGGNAPVKHQTHSKRISHVKMSSGEWVSIIQGSFNLYKNSDGIPFVEFKVNAGPLHLNNGGTGDAVKTIQLFPATVAGWAFSE